MIETILIAFDGSEQSKRAFEFGLEIAGRFNAKLVLFSVVRLPEPAISVEIDEILDNARQHFAEEFAILDKEASARGVSIETKLVAGHPAEKILSEAEELKADLIVMGRRGLTRVSSWILGSVSERVLRYAPCPVTVTK